GIYYDASRPSRLEALVQQPLSEAQARRAWALMGQWRGARASKYNHAREVPGLARDGDVLVVDQTYGDASIAFGAAGPGRFQRMLEAALDEHPHARILLKVHPDVIAGRKRGHFAALPPGAARRVQWLATNAHPPGLLERVSAVYTVTSQMGFEALLWGRPVHCFGLPFYAGWGLTSDDQPAPSRRGSATLAALAHAALIAYPRYAHPETRARCEVEELLDWVALQRRQRERFPPLVAAVGFSAWKRPFVQAFFAGSEVRFQGPRKPVPEGAALALWGRRELPPGAQGLAPERLVRLEDGFLRSVGLGAELVRPLSWVMDRSGLYYDAATPSDLEKLLQSAHFPPALCERALALRERILALGLTKYNVGHAAWQRPPGSRRVLLVVGQVESDAAVKHGAPGLRTNIGLLRAVREGHPQAYLVYKPHPDVVARLREQGENEGGARQWCDELVSDAPMDAMLRQVDEVHVLTSLTGFEALLRGKPVVTWGCPFYAGWGLTTDRQPMPWRQRRLPLDALVAAVLILYPTYVSRASGHFTTPERALEELQAWRAEAGTAPGSLGGRAWREAKRWALRWAQSVRRGWAGAPR
ncbi:MAG TPA: capsular polysaccharide biosynthesis protein, partial [Ideonella sp.]|nr:capsular polysaccharide biosynthesis protein [Ideonella sp.]